MAEPFPLQPSLWAATAPAAPPTPPLDQSIAAEVCIIGGGYAGLSTALHLAERGTRCVVLEDSRNGLIAAQAAGVPCVIVPNMVTAGSDFTGAHRIIESLEALSLEELLHPL